MAQNPKAFKEALHRAILRGDVGRIQACLAQPDLPEVEEFGAS